MKGTGAVLLQLEPKSAAQFEFRRSISSFLHVKVMGSYTMIPIRKKAVGAPKLGEMERIVQEEGIGKLEHLRARGGAGKICACGIFFSPACRARL